MRKRAPNREPLKVDEVLHTSYDEEVIVLSLFKKGRYTYAWVEFQDDTKHVTQVSASNALDGFIRNPYRKSVYGVGYLGEGRHSTSKNVHNPAYTTWQCMLKRTYCATGERKRAYKVCTSWHNFQVFAEWYITNRPKEDRVWFVLEPLRNDLYLYSPDTCRLSATKVKQIRA